MAIPTATMTCLTKFQHSNATLKAEKKTIAEDAIGTELVYLIKDSKHENEKPYAIRYDNGGVIPRTNMADESKPVMINDFRPLQNTQSFKEYGFTSAKLNCQLEAAEFDDDKRIKDVYYPSIEKLLWEKFPDAAEIKILEYGLRKRHAEYPQIPEESLKFTQPATHIHIDYSLHSAARAAAAISKTAPSKYRRLLTVNLWKSLQGPGNDWPLALCDWRTIDYSESIVADVVFPDKFTENERFYYSTKHEWYYFKDLGNDEVIIFRQTDSDLEGGGGVAHASFFNPSADKNAAPRMSIELRAFVFFG